MANIFALLVGFIIVLSDLTASADVIIFYIISGHDATNTYEVGYKVLGSAVDQASATSAFDSLGNQSYATSGISASPGSLSVNGSTYSGYARAFVNEIVPDVTFVANNATAGLVQGSVNLAVSGSGGEWVAVEAGRDINNLALLGRVNGPLPPVIQIPFDASLNTPYIFRFGTLAEISTRGSFDYTLNMSFWPAAGLVDTPLR